MYLSDKINQETREFIWGKGISGRALCNRFNEVVKAMNEYSSHTTRSGTDDEPVDGEFVQAVDHVMKLHKQWKQEKENEKNKANEENQKRDYQTEVIRDAATKRIKRNKFSSSGTDTDEPNKSDSDLKSSAVKLQSTMQEFLKAEMENRSVYKDQITAFHEVEKEGMIFREAKAKMEDERHKREMEDRGKDRECREKYR